MFTFLPTARPAWLLFGLYSTVLGVSAFARGIPSPMAVVLPPEPLSPPYLSIVAAPALRFQEPPLVAAPKPVNLPMETERAPDEPDVIVPNNESARPAIAPAEETVPEASSAAKSTPSPIIPDDTRPRIRAEDFLPFFQFPASATSGNDVNVVVPVVPTPSAPPRLPPSSATYRQQ